MARILFVEDEPAVREALKLALEDGGFVVEAADSAEDALRVLEQGPVDLLVTDFNMPGENGGWLIQEATRRGLYQGQALVVTAAHNLPRIPGAQVLYKPVDLDVLLTKVADLVAERSPRPVVPPRPVTKVELVLYAAAGIASLRAMDHLRRELEAFDPAGYLLRVVRIDQGGADEAALDAVAFTPTLVRRAPDPRAWAIGDAAIGRTVREWLELAGSPPRVAKGTDKNGARLREH